LIQHDKSAKADRLRSLACPETTHDHHDARIGSGGPGTPRQHCAALRAIVPGEGVIDSPAEMLPYESDGLMAYRQPPMVVVLPDTTEQVSQVLKYCFEQGIKVVPRGSGTSLSGGALPLADGVLLGLGKFKRIREIDFDNRVVVTEPGVTNLAIKPSRRPCRILLCARPSSQIACSIGGNVAENSGGVHCLKYGMTTTTCWAAKSC